MTILNVYYKVLISTQYILASAATIITITSVIIFVRGRGETSSKTRNVSIISQGRAYMKLTAKAILGNVIITCPTKTKNQRGMFSTTTII